MNKVIGIFKQINGMETENMEDIINKYNLIGSDSADLELEVCYDDNGNDVVVAKNSEASLGISSTPTDNRDIVTMKLLLNNKTVINGINSNIFNDEELTKKILNNVIEKNGNHISMDITINGKEYEFHNDLKVKQVYLLESRLFEKGGHMDSCYLQTFEPNGIILDSFEDDVRGRCDWDNA